MCKVTEDGMFVGKKLFTYFFRNVRMAVPVQVYPPGSNSIHNPVSIFINKIKAFGTHNINRGFGMLQMCEGMPYERLIFFEYRTHTAANVNKILLTQRNTGQAEPR